MKFFFNKILKPSLIIFLFATLARIGYLIWFSKFSDNLQFRPYIPTSNSRFYDSIAVSFLNGYGLNWYNIYQAHFPPLYPIFLSFIYSLFGHSYFAVFCLQAILSSLVPVFVFWIGKRIFNPAVGFGTALITVFYLPFITVIHDLELENLLIFMPPLFIVLLINMNGKSRSRKKIMAGIVAGLTVLAKPVFLFLLPLFTFLWLRLTVVKKDFWQTVFLIYLGYFLIISSWLLRNYIIYKKIFFSSQAGTAVWSTFNQNSFRLKTREILWSQPDLNEVEKNSFYGQEGMKIIKSNPILFLKQSFSNWQYLFFQNTSLDLPIPVIILALVGFSLSIIRKNKKSWVFFLLFSLFCAQYSALWTTPRFRLPLDWILLLFAVYALYSFWERSIINDHLDKFLKQKVGKIPIIYSRFALLLGVILFTQYFIKIAYIYLYPAKIDFPIIRNETIKKTFEKNDLLATWQNQNSRNIGYRQILNFQEKNQGDLTPFLERIVIWQGEVSYLNHNAYYPLGSAKHPLESNDPGYKGFFDLYFVPSREYSTFDLVVGRGRKPGYYGDGIVMVNYKGNLIGYLSDGDRIAVVGKIIGQNHLGQIFLEGYGVFK